MKLAENGIRSGICHAIHRYANYEYMNDYNKDKESSYLMYWYVNNLYGKHWQKKELLKMLNWKKTESLPERMKVKKFQKRRCNMYD